MRPTISDSAASGFPTESRRADDHDNHTTKTDAVRRTDAASTVPSVDNLGADSDALDEGITSDVLLSDDSIELALGYPIRVPKAYDRLSNATAANPTASPIVFVRDSRSLKNSSASIALTATTPTL
jgi:hypothetical protein